MRKRVTNARLKHLLLISACILPGTAISAHAQASSGGNTEIVVTAQKKQERLLDVPVSVSSVNSETLSEQNLVSIKDFYTRIPGIQLSGNTTQDISLRGVNAGGGTNPTVAILIDDIQFGSSTYLGRPPIPDLDPGTLERVEVLRGPQGTLYGASSLGGLIKYVTKEPSTTKWSGRAEIGAGTVTDGGDGWSIRGSVNAPILKDQVGLTISGFYRYDPRYIDSIVPVGTGTQLVKNGNKSVVWGGRAALLLKPIENLSITLAALYQKQDTAGQNMIPICSQCTSISPIGTEVTFDPRGVPDLRTARSVISPIINEFWLYSARANFAVTDNMQLVSLTAWGKNKQQNVVDATARFASPLESDFGPGTPTPVYPAGGTYLFSQPLRTDKFTQELRLAGNSQIADWLVGVFYTNERTSLDQSVDRVESAPFVTAYRGSNDSTYEEKAAFGAITFHVDQKFDVQVGARYAANEQTYRVTSVVDEPAQFIFGTGEDSFFTSKEHAVTWLISPSYKFHRDLMAYARVAKGYRPGGPNTQTPGATPSFAADTAINYELGLKGSVLDRRLTFDGAVFQIDWKNIQLQNTALPSQFVFFENGKKARSRGVELQISAKPWTGLSIDANATYLDAILTQSLDPSTSSVQKLLGVAGDRLPYSAKFTGNFSVQQDIPVTQWVTAFGGFNVNYVGNRYGLFNQNTLPGASTPARFARVLLPSYTVVDLRAGLIVDPGWQLNLYIRNLFDKKGFVSVDSRSGVQLPQAVLITPRTFGFTLSKTF